MRVLTVLGVLTAVMLVPTVALGQTDEIQGWAIAVVDRGNAPVEIEAGVGFGLTEASDKITLNLILSGDFNKPRKSAKPQSPGPFLRV
jgi:hypothetical protein